MEGHMSEIKFPAKHQAQGQSASLAWTAGGSCWYSQGAVNLGKALTACSTLTHGSLNIATGLRPMWRME